MKKLLLLLLFTLHCSLFTASAQSDNAKPSVKKDYQIYLKQPAKEIKLIWYEKDFRPIQGKLSDDKKSIIIKDYEKGERVRVKVIYEDGTEEDFIKSPCYIDPVALLNFRFQISNRQHAI
jgi:hypothetical protein